MKRLPLIFSMLAVIALSVSIAYWVMQLYKPAQRPLTATPPAPLIEPSADAAATLFGGQAVQLVATNYQLTGVVASGRESVAILVADGQPPKALKVGREVAHGVTVSEVHPRYVMLSEGGVLKRIELATDSKAGTSLTPPIGGGVAGAPGVVPPSYQQNQNQNQSNQQAPTYQQSQQPQQPNQPIQAPDAVTPPPAQQQQQQGVPPATPSVQMPMPNRGYNPGAMPPNQ